MIPTPSRVLVLGDDPTTFRRRLAAYHELTEPLIALFGRQGRLRLIDGVGDPAEVRRRLAIGWR